MSIRALRKYIACIVLALATAASSFVITAKTAYAEEESIYEINCTEEEAYNNGYEFYRFWYVINKGNARTLIEDYKGPEWGLVNKNRYGWSGAAFKSEMAYWRTLTFDIDDVILHSNAQKVNCTAMLFNLLYDANSETFAASPLTGAVDVSGNIISTEKAINDILKQMGAKEWSKCLKYLDEYNEIYDMDIRTIQDLEENTSALEYLNLMASKYSTFSNGLKYAGSAAKILKNCITVSEYIENTYKIGVIAGSSYRLAGLLSDMSKYTDDEAYKNALNEFSVYLQPYYEDVADELYTMSFAADTFLREAADYSFKAIVNALGEVSGGASAGLLIGASLGKFGGELLTGEDGKFKKFNELEVYYDFNVLLRSQLNRYVMDIKDGINVEDNVEKFNAGYTLLRNMYSVERDCLLEYYEILYKEGVINQAFPDINEDKYSHIAYNTAEYVNAVEELFEADEQNFKEAYEEAAAKYDPDYVAYDIIQVPDVQDNEESNKSIFDDLRQIFGMCVENDLTLSEDVETYGVLRVDGGTLDLNGNTITVYGDLIITGGTVTGPGMIEVTGSVMQTGGTVELTADTELVVGTGADGEQILGDYVLQEGSLKIEEGRLHVTGDQIIGYEGITNSNKITYTVSGNADIEIEGEFLAYMLFTGYQHANYNSFTSGTMTIGKSARVLNGTLNGSSSFEMTFSGSEDITLQNIEGAAVVIENAGGRGLVFKDKVRLAALYGDDMTIAPEDLFFGAVLNQDVVFSEGLTISKDTDLNGQDLTVNGDLSMKRDSSTESVGLSLSGALTVYGDLIQLRSTEYTSIKIDSEGILDISGNFEQQKGWLELSGGSLKVGGDHIIGYDGIQNVDFGNVTGFQRVAYIISDGGSEEIGGDLIAYKLFEKYGSTSINSLSSGSLTVGGSVRVLNGEPLNCSSGFTITCTGDEDLVLQNIYGGTMIIENAGERSLVFKDKVLLAELQGDDMTITPEDLFFGAVLNQNVIFSGEMGISKDTALNGYDMTVNGDLSMKRNSSTTVTLSLSGRLIVEGDLIQLRSSADYTSIKIDSEGILDISGNFEQQKGWLTLSGGSLKVGGDHIIGYDGIQNVDFGNVSGFQRVAYIISDGGSEETGGDLLAYKLFEKYGSTSINSLSSGSLTVGGNVRVLNGEPLNGSSGFTIICTGNEDITLQNIDAGEIVIENADSREIAFKEEMHLLYLTADGADSLSVTAEDLELGCRLNTDLYVAGDVVIDYATNLYGHKLMVNGSILQSNGSVTINEGTLEAAGDYYIAKLNSSGQYVSASSASLIMKLAGDRVIVGNDMLVYSGSKSTLTDGVLSIKGDFTQIGSSEKANFLCSGNHLTVLDGNELQTVTFGTYSSSRFNILELGQPLENYVFSPDPCWNTLIEYCEHLNTELRDAAEAGCLTEGYSGDLYCTDCGRLIEAGSVIEALGHDLVHHDRVEPTKTSEGCEEYWECTRCGCLFSDAEAAAELSELVIIPSTWIPVTDVSLADSEAVAGDTFQMTAAVLPADADDQTITWSLEDYHDDDYDIDRASIDPATGILTANSAGNVTVVATSVDGGIIAKCNVKILFQDMTNKSSAFYKAIYWAVDEGITYGVQDKSGYFLIFGEGRTCTRAQMVTFLWRLAGEPEPTGNSGVTFADVTEKDASKYYYKPVLWAAEEGITVGTKQKDGTYLFKPQDPCLRRQAVMFLWRMAGQPKEEWTVEPFEDVPYNDGKNIWYDPVMWAAQNNITTGVMGAGKRVFNEGNECLRRQMVTFLYRYANPDWDQE
ncbi:MAG: Ig-like domain-containing protein [Lachnospiraceae bacterium]|nr:Ig-like domain-containing protein [Lachnospiraceae bacterium]